jgi:hypothetical protein
MPPRNAPFNSTYEKFTTESAWLKERGLLPETLEHGVSQYYNGSRRSVYNGSVMLTIRRDRDGESLAN